MTKTKLKCILNPKHFTNISICLFSWTKKKKIEYDLFFCAAVVLNDFVQSCIFNNSSDKKFRPDVRDV